MENYDKVLKYTEASTESAGTANEKYEAVLESLDAKINTLTSTWDKMINNMNQSGTFAAVIDSGTKLIEILDVIINDWGILQNLVFPVAAIAGIKTAISSFQKYKNTLKELNDIYTKVIVNTTQPNIFNGKLIANKDSISTIKQVSQALKDLNNLKVSDFSNEFQTWAKAVKPLNADIQALTLNSKGLNAQQIALVMATNNVSAADTAAALAKAGYNKQTIQSALVTSNLATTENAASIAAVGYATATTAATGATSLFSKAVAALSAVWNASPFVIITAVVAAISGLVWIIDQCTMSIEEQREAVEQASQAYESAKGEVENLEQQIESISGKLDELRNIPNRTWVTEEEIEQLEIQNEKLNEQLIIAKELERIKAKDLLNEQQSLVDKTGYNYNYNEEQSGNIKQEFLGSEMQGASYLALYNPDDINSQIGLLDGLESKIQELEEEKSRLVNSENPDLIDIEEIDSQIETWQGHYDALESSMSETLSNVQSFMSAYEDAIDSGVDVSQEQTNLYNMMKNVIDPLFKALNPDEYEKLKISELLDTSGVDSKIEELKESLESGEISTEEYSAQIKDAIQDIWDLIKKNPELKEGLIEAGVPPEVFNNFEDLEDYLLEVLDITYDLSDATNEIDWSSIPDLSNESDLLGEFAENIDNLYNKYELLSQATQEYNENGYITTSLFKDLVDNNLVQYLSLTEDGLIANTNALNNESNALIANAQNTVKASLLKELNRIATEGLTDEEWLAKQASEASSDSNQELFNTLANGVGDILSAAQAIEIYNNKLGVKHDFSGQQAQVESVFATYQKQMSAINSIANSLQGSLGGLSSGIDKTRDSAEDATEKLEDLKDTLNDDRNAIEDLLDLTMDMLKQQYQDEIDALEKVIEGIEDAHETEQDRFDDRKEAAKDAYDLEIDRIDNLSDEWEDYYDEQKEALEDELDSYQKKIDAELKLLQLKEEEYQYEKELEEKISDVADIQDQLAALEFDNSIEAQKKKLELAEELAEKQEDLDEFQHDHDVELSEDALNNELDRFEDLQNKKLDALEKENEKKKEYYEEEKERLKDLYDNAIEQIEKESEAETEAYEKRKEEKEEEIETIEEYINREVNLRNEAISLIEARTDKFYQDLIQYNREYGTGVNRHPIYSDMY